MAFERSVSGQQNRARFLGAHFVCYVEGGESEPNTGIDAAFWRAVFAAHKPGVVIRFIARGGKPVLEALAQEIIDNNIGNTLVAMDAGYDHYFGETINDARVLYTHGYSIENDLFTKHNVRRIYSALAHVHDTPRRITLFLTRELGSLDGSLRLAVYADALALRAKSSVLPRDAPGRIIRVDRDTLRPIVNASEIKKLCGAANARTAPRSGVHLPGPVQVAKDCVGHIYRFAVTQVIKAALKYAGRRSTQSADHIRDVALQTFPAALAQRGEVARFHRDQLARS